jgi:hypothetical protein
LLLRYRRERLGAQLDRDHRAGLVIERFGRDPAEVWRRADGASFPWVVIMAASDPGSRPYERPTPTETALVEFANEIVNRLSGVGLSLGGAQALVGRGAAGERVAAAIDELDRASRDIRATVYELTRRGQRPAQSTTGQGASGVC